MARKSDDQLEPVTLTDPDVAGDELTKLNHDAAAAAVAAEIAANPPADDDD